MTCCILPDSIRYCAHCGELLLLETTYAAPVYTDSHGAPLDDCPTCGYWLSPQTTTTTPPTVQPASATSSHRD